jgi:hypothetical protein
MPARSLLNSMCRLQCRALSMCDPLLTNKPLQFLHRLLLVRYCVGERTEAPSGSVSVPTSPPTLQVNAGHRHPRRPCVPEVVQTEWRNFASAQNRTRNGIVRFLI